MLFRCSRPPFRDKNIRLRLCGYMFHLKHQYTQRYPSMLETPSYHMPSTDPIISYHMPYSPPPQIPNIKTLYYDACNATPTGSSAVHDFSNTRRPTSFLESYPAASTQTSNNALIARLSPLISIFIFANRAWYGHYTKGCAKTIKSLNIHYERLNVITHGLLMQINVFTSAKHLHPYTPKIMLN